PFSPARRASRITYHPAQIEVEPNGSPCACTIAGRFSTRSSAVNETQCASAPVRSTTACAYGRSSKPASSKYAVTVFWCSCPWYETPTAIADESTPPERQV